MISELFRRIWFFLNRRRLDRALADEMEFHREMMEREGRSGFGGTLRLREEARDAWGWLWLDRLGQDLKYGVRVLRKSPGFTVAAVAVLSLGIGGNTAMFSLIHATLLKPLPYRDSARLVFARATFSGNINPFASAPDYYDYREQADLFERFSAVLGGAPKVTVTGGEGPDRAAFTYVEHDVFRTLGVAPAAGRWFTPEEGRPGGPVVAMIGERFADRQFGAPGRAVGGSLAVAGRVYTVIGVMPATFRFLQDVDIWAPMRRGEDAAGMQRQFHNWLIVGRLKPGVSLQSARHQVDAISRRLEQAYPDSNKGKALQLDPLQETLSGSQRPRLLVLWAAVGLVLLIACANVAGLLLARGSARRAELAMRAALGASRARITGQLLVESVTLALVSGALGMALAFWLNRLLRLAPGLGGPENAPKGLELPVLLFTLGLSVLAGVLFGVAPALRASSMLRAPDLTPSSRVAGRMVGASLRGALVVGQVAVSLVLLVGAGLLIRSFSQLSGTNPGFDVQHLLTGEVELSGERYSAQNQRIQFFDGLREDFASIPGVRAAGFVSSLPLRNPSFNLGAWATDRPPAPRTDRPMAHRRVVLPGYFAAVGIPLRAGRDFGTGDRENAPLTMIINERMARTLFPEGNPMGRRVTVDMFGQLPAFEVVGVVGDARLDYIGDSAPATMYLSYYQYPDWTLRFAVRTDQEPEAISHAVRSVVLARDRGIPVETLTSMERIIGESVAPQRVIAVLLTLLAAVAALLASIGLYGVLAYSVIQRTRELGLRTALGARPADLLRLVMGQGAALASAGVVMGLGGAVVFTRFLENLLFGVRPRDPLTLAVVALGLLGVSLLATYIPARRAARVDPMVALRYE